MEKPSWFSWTSASSAVPKGDKETTQSEREASDRYKLDMEQALAMRGRLGAPSSSSRQVTSEDVKLALAGLDQAGVYREAKKLSQALKLYELSLELLIKVLREETTAVDKSTLEARVHAALSDAEQVKEALRHQPKTQQPSAEPSGESSPQNFQAISTRLSSALAKPQRSRPRKKPPSSTLRAPQQQAAGQQSSLKLTASEELRRTILEDIYLDPSELQQTTWDDISGLETVKQSLQETAILPLMRPDLFGGLRRPQHVMLYGPPGTGKTMLVRAVARESSSHLFVCTAATLTSKWMGEAEKLVRTLFQVARENVPSIIFIDEVDALLSSRKSEGEHEASRRLKTEVMVQMEGIAKTGDANVLVLACTNCPWDIDPAVLRRFPRRIYVPLPDSEARRGLLEHLLEKAGKHSLSSRQLDALVRRTDGYSCSDITAIASEASFGPLRSLGGLDAVRNVRAQDMRPISMADFESALSQASKSVTASHLRRFEEWKTETSS